MPDEPAWLIAGKAAIYAAWAIIDEQDAEIERLTAQLLKCNEELGWRTGESR